VPVRLALEAMATRFEVVLDGGEPRRLQAAGEQALDRIREEEERLSAFRRDSLVARLNRAAGGPPVAVDGEFLELLQLCRRLHRETGGAFDPTVGGRMQELGHHPGGGCSPARWGFGEVEIDTRAGRVRLPESMRLDLGGIGKGWALDLARGELQRLGVTSALLHGGASTVAALGVEPYEEGWAVAIRDRRYPVDPGTGPRLAARRLLRNQALSVSAPDGRKAGAAGHVVDPRTGEPAAGTALAAAVCPSAAAADAWSTALLVLGKVPEEAPLDWALLLPPLPESERVDEAEAPR